MSSRTRPNSDRKRAVLSAECLEDRTVPAGNIAAFVSGGGLQIVGDGASNQVWVMGLDNGQAIVAPLNGTTVNGSHAPLILGGIMFGYNIQLGNGHDYLWVTNTKRGNSLFVDTGRGHDCLAVDYANHDGMTVLSTGAGNDYVSVGMGDFGGFTTLDMGQGDNCAQIAATEFGGLAFRGGTGTDAVGLLAVQFNSMPSMSGLDQVYSTLMPIAGNDRARVRQGKSVTINVAANDSAPGSTLNRSSVRVTEQPEHGTVRVNGDGTITYTANEMTTATDSFKYTIRNASGAVSNEATVSLVLVPDVPPSSDPVATITANTGDRTNATTISYTVTFNEDVTGFVADDVGVTNGAVSNFASTNARTYTFTVTPTAEGAVAVNLAAGAAKDAENNNSAAASKTITIDRTGPTVTVTTTASNPTHLSPIPFTVTFSEDVTEFVANDITVTNGTLSNFASSNGRTYTFNVAPTADGPVTITVAASSAKDAASNTNTSGAEFTITSLRTSAGMSSPSNPPPLDSPNWQTTASGLKIWDVQTGTGTAVVATSTLRVFYIGWLTNGTSFESALTTGSPVQFPLANLIPGWKEGLLGMQPGGIRRLFIPSELAYGETGQGDIPPNADLIFEIKLLSVV